MSKVSVFVYNSCRTDARVLKEAATLADQGYEVRIVALLDKLTEPVEHRDNFTIVRVEKNPLHYRILKNVRFGFAKFKRGLRMTLNIGVRGITFMARGVMFVLTKVLSLLGMASSESKEGADTRIKGEFWELLDLIRQPKSLMQVHRIAAKHPVKFVLFGWLFFLLYNIYYFFPLCGHLRCFVDIQCVVQRIERVFDDLPPSFVLH